MTERFHYEKGVRNFPSYIVEAQIPKKLKVILSPNSSKIYKISSTRSGMRERDERILK